MNLPDDLRGFAEQQAQRLGFPSVSAYLLELPRAARARAAAPNGQPFGPESSTSGDPFAFVDELAQKIPEEELAKLPADGSIQLDHYLYGHPKKDRP